MKKHYLTNTSAPKAAQAGWRGWLWGMMLAVSLALPLASQAQQTISGTIKDAKGESIPGVGVLVKGTTRGTATDADGKFQLAASTGEILVATFTGYKNQEVTIGAETTLDIILQEDGTLDEVVVIGYGTQNKRDVIGSIAQVKGSDIKNVPSPSFDAALQGRAAGVQIVQSSGVPGSAVRMRIRGQASVSGNSEPLYIVDGVPVTTGDFSKRDGSANSTNSNALADLNPNDIESIEILKDAGAAAIYGSRAANGVVLITTKRGKAGKTAFDAGYYYGINQVTRKLPFINAAEQLTLIEEGYRNANGGLPMPANFGLGRGLTVGSIVENKYSTNWFDQVLRQGYVQEANINARGGNEKTRFYTGVSYRDEDSFFKGNNYKRISGRLNLDNSASDKLDIGTQISVTGTTNNQVPNVWGTVNSSALPFFPIKNADDTYFGNTDAQGQNTGANPVAQMQNSFVTKGYRVLANAYANYKITKDLVLRAEFGSDFYNQYDEILFSGHNRTFITFDYKDVSAIAITLPDTSRYPKPLPRVRAGSFEERRLNVFNWNTNITLTYNKTFAEVHRFDVLGGFQAQQSAQRTTGVYTNGNAGFADPYFNNAVGGLQIFDKNLVNGYPVMGGYNADLDNRYNFASFFGRLMYKYGEKYLASASIRTDGSSRFGPDRQFGTFYSFSAGWIINEESFLKDVEFIDMLKLRASLGVTGNSEIGNFNYLGTFGSSGGYLGQPGLYPSRISNPDLGWEKNRNLDLGIDFALFKGRISGSVSYFNKRSSDILFADPIQSSVGQTAVLRNTGIVIRNQGVEFNVATKNLGFESPIQWTTDFNISTVGNEVLSTGDLPVEAFAAGLGESRLIVGYPVGQGFMMQSAGVDPADGREMFVNPKDGSRNNKIGVENTDWRVPVGRPFPRFSGGMMNTVSYKGFDLSILLTYQYGNTVFDNEAKFQIGEVANNAQRRAVLNRWQSPEKPGDGKTPGIFTSGPGSGRGLNSDRFMYDASFLRLRTATLAYNLPKGIVEKAKLTSVRLYITGQNLFVITKYPGWDPEFVNTANVNNTGQFFTPFGASGLVSQYQQANITFNAAQNPLPQQRTIIVGINIGF